MKICYLSNGKKEAVFIQKWANYFAKKHDVSVISYHGIKGFDKSVDTYHIPIKSKSKIGKILGFFNFIRESQKIIKEIKPDIVHAYYVTNYGFTASLTNYHHLIVSICGSDVLVNPKQSILMKWAIKHALKKADLIVPTAQFMEKYLVEEFKLPKDKIIIIPWGADLGIFHRGYKKEVKKLRKYLKIGDDSPVVISNRSMAPIYQIEKIIESIPYVIKKYPNTVFIFLRGSGTLDFEEKMKIKAKNLGVIKNIRFVSRLLNPKEMAIYLNASDIFISIPKTDQFSDSITEGMICSTMAIVSNAEAYKQHLKNGTNAFFINHKPKKISKKIMYCIDHPELKRKFYKINKKIVEEHGNWYKNAEKMENLYKNFKRW